MDYTSKYDNYIHVNENYNPEINPQASEVKQGRWKETYPHEKFIELLKAVEEVLSKRGGSTQKGIWIQGSYGTGKSRSAWTLAEILKCSSEDLDDYFNKYPDKLADYSDLKDRLNHYKDGTIVVPFRYGAGGITNVDRLIDAMYECISSALKDKNLDFIAKDTIRGVIIRWLSSETNVKIFETLKEDPAYNFAAIESMTAKDIIDLLKSTSSAADTIDAFIKLSEKGYLKLNNSDDDIISWIKEIISTNNIKSIVFIWDEFSSFFINNPQAVDVLQKLAELSNDVPFYLAIVTHDQVSLIEYGSRGQILSDRFIKVKIDMPNKTAVELISTAITPDVLHVDEWNKILSDLSSRVSQSLFDVSKGIGVDEKYLTKVLPIHPYAVLALKNISELFASNQRSMFNFIKMMDDSNLQAFQWFIKNYGPYDDNFLLTIDFLWDFFYNKGTDPYGHGQGRDNLERSTREILDISISHEHELMDIENRVLRTLLIMQGISQRLNDSIELLIPTIKNISRAFEGTAIEDQVRGIIIGFAKKGIVVEITHSGSEKQYRALIQSKDTALLDSFITKYKDTKTGDLISNDDYFSPERILSLSPSQKPRFVVKFAAVETFAGRLTDLTSIPRYCMGLLVAFAKDRKEQATIRRYISEKVASYPNIVFLDTTSVTFESRLDSWSECMAQSEVYKNDVDVSTKQRKQADSILRSWGEEIHGCNFTAYYKTENYESIQDNSDLKKYLGHIISNKYVYSFDLAIPDQVYRLQNAAAIAGYGIKACSGSTATKDAVSKIFSGLKIEEEYWHTQKEHPISKLKNIVDVKIKEALSVETGGSGQISIKELFDSLIDVGFMPVDVYAYLYGFILKEYVNGKYWYRVGDGIRSDIITPEYLKNAIGDALKSIAGTIPNYKEIYIVQISAQQRTFIEASVEIFGCDGHTVSTVVQNIRVKMKDLDYPIWCLKLNCDSKIIPFIDNYVKIANSKNEDGNQNSIATDLGQLFINNPDCKNELVNLFSREKCRASMQEFLNTFDEGSAIKLSSEIGADLLKDVKSLYANTEGLWLWNQEVAERIIRGLITDYKIISISNDILGFNSSSKQNCIGAWVEKIKSVKIPASVLKIKMPNLDPVLDILVEIFKNRSFDADSDYHEKILNHLLSSKDELKSIFESTFELFCDLESIHLDGFNENDIRTLMSKLPPNSFGMDVQEYNSTIIAEAKIVKDSLKRNKLRQLWFELSGSKTPEAWSQTYCTPILAIVSPDDYSNAERLFNTISAPYPLDADLDFSLDYLNHDPLFLKHISDVEYIDSMFSSEILKKYAVILTDLDAVRKVLLDTDVPPIRWMNSRQINEKVEQCAEDAYENGERQKLLDLISEMSADEAKKYLKEIVADSISIGVEILSR